MTQTASFKDKVKTGWAVFKWEMRNCKSPLIVFAILAGVFTVIPLVLCLTFGFSAAVTDDGFNYSGVLTAIQIFQLVSTYAVFALNAVFTIIYTIKIYSYLHNKRKADMYGAMPVSRRTFYISKTLSAFAISVLPTMFFFGLISVISACFGQLPVSETVSMYSKLLLGSLSCISLYSLLAVCCGTSVNAVLSFVAINLAYPVVTLFIRGIVGAFTVGLNADVFNQSFVMNALTPLSAYSSGSNAIYWILFTAACMALGTYLIKKRKAESAQTSFAYYLPCYVVKLLVSFIFGMFIGVLFGSLNVFGAALEIDLGYLSFVFGFLIGSIPAYIITHIIFYKGIGSLMKTAIPYASMTLFVVGAMALMSFDIIGYNTYVPKLEDIESAGLIYTSDCYQYGRVSNSRLLREAADDFSSDKASSIASIHTFHEKFVNETVPKKSNEKFGAVWAQMVLSNFPSEFFNNGYGVSYKLKNGRTVTRLYTNAESYSLFNYSETTYEGYAQGIANTDEYFENYSSAVQAKPSDVQALRVELQSQRKEIKGDRAKIAKVLEAYRKDYREHGKGNSNDLIFDIRVKPSAKITGSDSFYSGFFSELLYGYDSGYGYSDLDNCEIYSNYTETIDALTELNILAKNADGTYRLK